MNTFSIAINYLKQNLKRPVLLILLVLCPVILILILGQVFSGIFTTGLVPADIPIAYNKPYPANADFPRFTRQLEASGITLHAVDDIETGIAKVAEGEYRVFLLLNGRELTLYTDNSIQAGIVEGLIRNFILQHNSDKIISRLTTSQLESGAPEQTGGYITREVLAVARQQRALDYMGIIILTMTILFGSHLAAFAVSRERILKTINRIYAAPVRQSAFFAGIVLGILATLIIQMTAVFLAGKYLLGIYYGGNLLRVAVILLCECFFSIALGTSIAALAKDAKTATGLMNILLPVLIFLGGGYMRLPDNIVFNLLSRFSPLEWVNKALLGEIYGGWKSYYLPAVYICLAAGTLLLIMAGNKMIRSKQK